MRNEKIMIARQNLAAVRARQRASGQTVSTKIGRVLARLNTVVLLSGLAIVVFVAGLIVCIKAGWI